MGQTNPQRLYFGTFRLYQSTDAAGSWNAISTDLTSGANTVTAIGVAQSNPDTVYVGTGDGRVQVTNSALSGTDAKWTDRSSRVPNRVVTQIAVDPTNSSTAYVTLSGFALPWDSEGNVLTTTNGAETWQDITSNLPNIPMNDIVIDPDLPKTLYVASDLGTFGTNNGGTSWSVLGSGLPQVSVMGLKLHRPTRTLRAATYGRGMWDLAVVPIGIKYPVPVVTSISPVGVEAGSSDVRLTVQGAGFTGQSLVQWNGTSLATAFVNSGEVDVILPDTNVSVPGLYEVTVTKPQPGGGTSQAVRFTVTAPSINITNAASFASGVVAPGALATIFGHGLTTGVQGIESAASTPWPLQMQGTSVTIAGVAAPLFALADVNGLEQINLQVPFEIESNSGNALVMVNNDCITTAFPAQVFAAQPGIYADGNGNGIVTHAATGQLVTASNPAYPGEFVTIYANALGPLDVQPATNSPAGVSPLSRTIQTPSVTVAGVAADVTFSGLTPYFVGLCQLNVQIPQGVGNGSTVSLVVTVINVRSNTVRIAVSSQ
jgi:uncharacterized protein (TIGR03437 family)